MFRLIIGVTMVFGSFAFKALLNHNVEYWGAVKSWTIFFFVIGLVVLGLPIFEWIEKSKPKTFKIDPPKFILYVIKAGIAVVVMVAIGIQLETIATWTNDRVVEYYLNRETERTKGVIVGKKRVPYTIKYTTHYETFYIIQYVCDGKTIEKGVKRSPYFKMGRSYNVLCSREFPSMFKIE